MGGVVGLTIARDWPWTHTVFFVLHGLVLLMKQHSYAFYNGHLSTVSKDRSFLLHTLGKLEGKGEAEEAGEDPAVAHSTSISSPTSTNRRRRSSVVKSRQERKMSKHEDLETAGPEIDQIISDIESDVTIPPGDVPAYKAVLDDEIDFHTKELVRNTTARERAYPNNLTLSNLAEYLVLPTVVYELEYPRTESINWYYVIEKLAATVGILFVMSMLSQTFICKLPLPFSF